jgi:glycerophosphoryl diester phosphodiesterase
MPAYHRIIVTALIAAVLTVIRPLSGLASPVSTAVLIVAHRGASDFAPENTMAAFRKAVLMNADYIEFDVQLSKDGRPVVIHDRTVDRTTNGTGKVRGLTYAELRRLDAGSWFNPSYAGEKIPSLDEVLDAFIGKIGLLIELKAQDRLSGIERKVADALPARNMHMLKGDAVIVQSFDFVSIRRFHAILPTVPVAVLTSAPRQHTDTMLETFRTFAHYVNPNFIYADKPLMDRIHSLGMRAIAWTVNKPRIAARLRKAGIDGIITNDPAGLQPSGRLCE